MDVVNHRVVLPLLGRTHFELSVYEEHALAGEQDLHDRLRLCLSSLRDEGDEDGDDQRRTWLLLRSPCAPENVRSRRNGCAMVIDEGHFEAAPS